MPADEPASDPNGLLDSGEEAGTAPGDRTFRPDVEGLRAVAILLVVLFHFGLPHLRSGFIGVDVFFVISGFVITGVLLQGFSKVTDGSPLTWGVASRLAPATFAMLRVVGARPLVR